MSTPPEPGDRRPPEPVEPLPPSAPTPDSPRRSVRKAEPPAFPPPVPALPGAAAPPPRRSMVPIAGGAVLAVLVCALVAYLALSQSGRSVESIGGSIVSAGPPPATASGRGPAPQVGAPLVTSSAAAAGAACTYAPAERGEGDTRLIATPAPRATLAGRVSATIQTNLGPIGLQLYADRAPCTVNSFVHLSRDDFYSDTPCHRLTTDGLYVLQCGDPSGTGTGTPGYQFGEENLPTTVPPYPRGTLAMANAGPGTNGSQFFLVYKDSDIPADYTVFGTVTSGLDLLDRIAAAGTATGGPDGPPKLTVQISEIRVA
ncbi:peptidylprolyl isomerase [Dactylosporangium sp. CA-139066]|uniref:peptidylprolyl isomerase n=1 Tax=Dactylosporangium sp. CA-139066 TaxID=3239930 RepID=UPI003D8C6294